MSQIVSATEFAEGGESFMLIGANGAGKTSQGLTLPRPTLFIAFDPNVKASIRGFPEVDMIGFYPEDTGIIKPTKNHKAKDAIKYTPNVLNRFIEWFNAAVKDTTFDRYRSIVLDSTTWLETAVYEDVMYERGRFGQPPDKDDYAALRDNMMKVLYPVASLAGSKNKHVLINVHLKDKTDRGGAVIGQELFLTGQGRQLAPTLVSNAFAVEYQMGKGPEFSTGARYVAYTRPHAMLNLGRSSQKRRILPYTLDLTIQDWRQPQNYGLGKLIQEIEAGAYEDFAEIAESGEIIKGGT